MEPEATPDVIECKQFYQHICVCGCDKDRGRPCSKQFPLEHFIERRTQCSFLTKEKLDLALMGFVSSAMLKTDSVKDGRHVNPAKCKRLTMTYKHHGWRFAEKRSFFCKY